MQTKKLILSLLFSFLFINQAHSWPIPDTGQTKCYDNEYEIPCPKPGEPFYGQDGNYNINPPSYTKLDEKGNDLPDDAETWVMVRDNVTGLIWEVKNNKEEDLNYLSLAYPFELLQRNMIVAITYQNLYDFNKNINFNIKTETPVYTNDMAIAYSQKGRLSALGLGLI